MSITLPGTALIESGELHLKYSLPKVDNSEANEGGIETVDVLLNDSALASITPSAQDLARRGGYVVIPLPVDQLVRENRLTLRLAGPTALAELNLRQTRRFASIRRPRFFLRPSA